MQIQPPRVRFYFDHSATLKSPTTRRLYDYWQSKCGDRPRPQWSDFDLLELLDISRFIVVRDVVDGGKDFYCRYWGTGLADMYHFDCTGQLISESWSSNGVKNTLELYHHAMSSEDLPTRCIGDLGYVDKNEFVSFEAVMLPLDGVDGPMQHFIGVFHMYYELDSEDLDLLRKREKIDL